MMNTPVHFGRWVLEPFAAPATRELYAIRNHPTVRPFMANPALIPYRSHITWTRQHLLQNSGLHLWMVRPVAKRRAIGFTQLRMIAGGATAEIGVMFREPEKHRLTAGLATALSLQLAFEHFHCTWVISYVIPSHRQAIDFNLAWGASVVESDKPGMVMLKLHRETCAANPNYLRVLERVREADPRARR